MKITNVHNLPAPLIRSIRNDKYSKGRNVDYSATDLTRPPLNTALKALYGDDVITDASSMLWMLSGKAVHYIIEMGAGRDELAELRLMAKLDDHVISGQIDLLKVEGESVLWDWKQTSMYAAADCIENGVKQDWLIQTNIYAWLARKNGEKIDEIRIGMILRDHSYHKAMKKKGIDKHIPFAQVTVPIMSDDEIESFMRDRITEIESNIIALAQHIPPPRPCTDDERFSSGDVWAVKKKGNKTAVSGGLKKNSDDAYRLAEELKEKTGKEHIVEFRPAEEKRCVAYCDMAPFCPATREESREIAIERVHEIQKAIGEEPTDFYALTSPRSHSDLKPGDFYIAVGEDEYNRVRTYLYRHGIEFNARRVAKTYKAGNIYKFRITGKKEES